MKGKALPLVVYDVGEELGTREGVRRCAAAVPRPRRGAGHGAPASRALGGAGGVLAVDGADRNGQVPPGRMRRSRPPRRATTAWCSGLSRTGRRAPTGCCATRCAPCSASTRASREAMGTALLQALAARRPRPAADGAAARRRRRRSRCRSTPEADRIDPQYRADRVADARHRLSSGGWSGAARGRRRGGALGGRGVGRTCSSGSRSARRAGRGRSSWYGDGEPAGSPRRPVPGSTSIPCPGGDRAARPRRHRGHTAAPARGRRRRGARRRATRSSSRR